MLLPAAVFLLATAPLTILSLPTAATEVDACAIVIQKQDQTLLPSEIARCYDSFPYNVEIAKKTFRAINNLVEVYAFADIMNNSPDPNFQQNVDVVGQLAKLSKATFSTDRQFHEAIADVFTPLNDGHTAYVNYCYSQFAFMQPLTMVTDFVSGINDPKIIIQSYDSTLPQPQGIKLMDYVGAEVLAINGVPTLEALQTYADTYFGTSKDPGTRLTQTLSGIEWNTAKSSFSVTRGAFNARVKIPKEDALVYELKLPNGEMTKITIPWFVKRLNPTAAYKDSKSYWKQFCMPFSVNSESENREKSEPAQIPIEQRLQQLPIFEKKSYERVSPSALRGSGDSAEDESPLPNFPKPVVTGPKIAFFVFPNTEGHNIGVFKMSSFDAPTNRWIEAMKKGFATLKEKRAEKIILDFSGNGGGVICTAYAILKLLSPGKVQPFKTDIRLGGKLKEVAAKASENNIFHPSHWLDENGQNITAKTGLLDPARFKKLPSGAKSTTPYTNLFLDKCGFQWIEDVKGILPWDHKDIIFLTDGMCGSSCALVQNHIKEQTPNIRTVVATSAPSNIQVTASTLPGGMVYRASYLSSDISDALLTSQMDVNFPVAADFNFAFREAYSRKRPDEVLEYMKTLTDIRVNRNADNALNIEKLWLDTANLAWDKEAFLSPPPLPAPTPKPNPLARIS